MLQQSYNYGRCVPASPQRRRFCPLTGGRPGGSKDETTTAVVCPPLVFGNVRPHCPSLLQSSLRPADDACGWPYLAWLCVLVGKWKASVVGTRCWPKAPVSQFEPRIDAGGCAHFHQQRPSTTCNIGPAASEKRVDPVSTEAKSREPLTQYGTNGPIRGRAAADLTAETDA